MRWCKMASRILLVTCLCIVSKCVDGVTRKFYIAAVEDYWDYQPDDSGREPFKKAVYKEFTDETFTVEKEKPKWRGFIGPTMYAEEDDVLEILFLNNASQTYSLHPHGMLYGKHSEGAMYMDGYHGNATAHTDDIVDPGDTHVYHWVTTATVSPAEGDPDCLSYIYHSHVNTPKDINSGLIGFLFACRKGTLDNNIIHKHYSIYVTTFDETSTWYFKENKQSGATSIGTTFSALNGYVNGNMPDLNACVGENVIWHFASMGTFTDLHSLSLSGHSFSYFQQTRNFIDVSVGQFATAHTKSLFPGQWLLQCSVNKHITNGMQAYFNVKLCDNIAAPKQKIRKIRRHYIAAEEVLWNYSPTGVNGITGDILRKHSNMSDDAYWQFNPNASFGGVFKKAVFRAYDDYHFTTTKIRQARPEHMGILGPVIKAEVGDLIEVVFKNKASRPYSMHAEGVAFSKKSEGVINPNTKGLLQEADNQVAPGEIYTYFWKVPQEMSPTDSDPACLTRTYMSGVDPVKDTMSGLIGPLLICKPGTLDKTEKQANVDKEFFLMFAIFYEKQSWYYQENLDRVGLEKVNQKSVLMNSINGLMYAGMKGLEMCLGDKVIYHVFTVGDTDLHTVQFHGNVFTFSKTHRASMGIMPGARKTMRMVPDNIGVWKLDCMNFRHLFGGETALYTVNRCGRRPPSPRPAKGKKRIFYIQAEDVDWDYLPLGKDLTFGDEIPVFIHYPKYRKVVYRRYTDETFSTPSRTEDEAYLGVLGPIIRVEEGDILSIVFRNKGPASFSIHPLGLIYRDKGRSDKGTNAPDQPSVLPGKTFTYSWAVRKSIAPGYRDNNCTGAMYFSDVNIARDTHSGLVGPLIICRKGMLDQNGMRKDVIKDFAVQFNTVDESFNWHAQGNLKRCKAVSNDCDLTRLKNINGFIFGNMPHPTMPQFAYVDWYIMNMGNYTDYHPVHFHGNDYHIYDGKNHVSDVTPIMPGTFHSIKMYTMNPGHWLFHCHVNAHIQRGMESMYIVKPIFDSDGAKETKKR